MSGVDQYRIIELVDDKFADHDYWQLDFRRHLKPEVALEKEVIFLENGRPDYAIYTYESTEFARLQWTFTNQPDSALMLTRKEEVAYYKLDDSLGDYFVIKNDTYDMTKQDHRQKVLTERIKGRSFILDDLKAVVMGTLAVINPGQTEDQISQMGADFWELHLPQLVSFVETGSKNIVTSIGADTTTTWLLDEIQPGVTIGAYMQSRLNY